MKIKHKIIIILTTLLAGILVVTGCTSGATSRGWAGGAVSDGKLFVASMNGKLIAIDSSTGMILGNAVQLTTSSSGGLSCSCSGAGSTVAIYASPVLQGQMVYIGGTDGKLYAYVFENNALRAEPEWIYPRQGTMSGAIIGGLVIANGTIYFATSDGILYALNADGLYEEWTYDIGDKTWSAPVIDGDTLYIGSFDKKLYALNAADGTLKWEYETKGSISSTPIVYDNKIYIGDYSRHFYALDTNGRLVWEYPPTDDENEENPQNWFWATPVVLDGVVYAPCLDGNVYALDAATGNLTYKYVLGNSISSSPVIAGDAIVVATTDLYKKTGKVFVIKPQNKSQEELDSFTEGIDAPLFVCNDIVYVHTTKDNLYGINPVTKAKQTFSLSTVK